MKRIVSAITATGKLTIGNYLGAIEQCVELQNNNELFISVADLHALTIDVDPKTLKEDRKSIMALYLACGLNPDKATLFMQSDVKEHTYLNWILLTKTSLGELSRMTQFKDKSLTSIKTNNNTETVPTGLLIYPTLMAADILLYNAQIVPVGIDQKQHIELTKTIAKRFNNKYKTKFVIPEIQIPKIATKIKSLTDPSKKMSKSDPSTKSAIYLLDDPNIAYRKIMKSKTDNENKVYISDQKEGVKNLLFIYSAIEKITIEVAEKKFKYHNYAEFKTEVATSVKNLLIRIQKKYNQYLTQVDLIAKEGAKKASNIAKETIKMVKEKMGL